MTEHKIQVLRVGDHARQLLVIVRIRPLNEKELAVSQSETVCVVDSRLLTLLETQQESKKCRPKQFVFDSVFGKHVSTKKIYEETIGVRIDGLLEGYNSTVIAYGATGCGKTFTMIGESGNQGIIPLAMIDLLSKVNVERRTKNIVVRLSYIEIYNENIKDLLISEDRNFQIREDPKEGVQVPGVTELTISTLLEIQRILKVAHRNRSQESTLNNQVSSRSHSLLIVKIDSKDKNIQDSLSSRFCLVDLAGSERASGGKGGSGGSGGKGGSGGSGGKGGKGGRSVEGAKINKSLLILGNCIHLLSEAAEKGMKDTFIPYRSSKLTRLLKQSLGGNCRTTMIANISPCGSSFEETHNTLIYASRAMSIRNNLTKNVNIVESHLSNYVQVISTLKRENEELKRQIRANDGQRLPALRSAGVNIANIEIERTEAVIEEHFSREWQLMKEIDELQGRLDSRGYNLFILETEDDKAQSSPHYIRHKQSIQKIVESKYGLEQRLQGLVLKRADILDQIKRNELLSSTNQQYLVTYYKEKKVETELRDLNLKEKALAKERKEIDKIVGLLKSQPQQVLFKKNKILNRITYSKLADNSFESARTEHKNKKLSERLFKQEPSKNRQNSKRKDEEKPIQRKKSQLDVIYVQR